MARARNIKPGFFMNEDLAELDYGIRLLFIGLWTLSDREGRLEDRPRRIKRELFPSDTLDVEEALRQLEGFGFIKRYKFEEFSVIQIIKFLDHQSPHGTEKDSELPDENGLFTVNERSARGLITGKSSKILRVNAGLNASLTVQEPLNNDSETVNPPCNNALNPDSGFLNPDSYYATPAREEISPPVPENQPPPTREGGLCRKLRAIGIDASPTILHADDWKTILAKRSDEQIIEFASTVRKRYPEKRIGLKYLAPGLLEEPKPLPRASPGARHPPMSAVDRVRAANPLPEDFQTRKGDVIEIGASR